MFAVNKFMIILKGRVEKDLALALIFDSLALEPVVGKSPTSRSTKQV